MGAKTSICVFRPEAAERGSKQDLQIETQRPMLDVIEIVVNAIMDRRVSSEPVNLRPARDARLHHVAEVVTRNLLLEFFDEDRALRPWSNQTHVTSQHIDKLRKLIERGLSQERAEWRSSRIVLN